MEKNFDQVRDEIKPVYDKGDEAGFQAKVAEVKGAIRVKTCRTRKSFNLLLLNYDDKKSTAEFKKATQNKYLRDSMLGTSAPSLYFQQKKIFAIITLLHSCVACCVEIGKVSDETKTAITTSTFCNNYDGWRNPWDQDEILLCGKNLAQVECNLEDVGSMSSIWRKCNILVPTVFKKDEVSFDLIIIIIIIKQQLIQWRAYWQLWRWWSWSFDMLFLYYCVCTGRMALVPSKNKTFFAPRQSAVCIDQRRILWSCRHSEGPSCFRFLLAERWGQDSNRFKQIYTNSKWFIKYNSMSFYQTKTKTKTKRKSPPLKFTIYSSLNVVLKRKASKRNIIHKLITHPPHPHTSGNKRSKRRHKKESSNKNKLVWDIKSQHKGEDIRSQLFAQLRDHVILKIVIPIQQIQFIWLSCCFCQISLS